MTDESLIRSGLFGSEFLEESSMASASQGLAPVHLGYRCFSVNSAEGAKLNKSEEGR